MSNGGKVEGRSKREKDNSPNPSKRACPDEFGRAISKIAVAQLCESIGFQSFNDSALESLADIAVRYINDLGKTANFYANLGSRTESNMFDVILGLEDLGSSLGFSGASESSRSVTDSGVVREIVEYVESAEEIPFAQLVPRFPVARDRRGIPSFVEMGETPAFRHVPAWLPAFPDAHTYIRSPVWNERVTDPRADKMELARQRRKAERSLLSLQQRLVGNDSIVASTSGEPVDDGQGLDLDKMEISRQQRKVERSLLSLQERLMGNDSVLASTSGEPIDDGQGFELDGSKNPFLAKPILQDGGENVSKVGLPAKFLDEVNTANRVTLMETFAPAIEALRGGICESDDSIGAEKILSEKRPAVFLKFKGRKKILGEPLELSLRKKGITVTGLGREDERDDKKRRAEYILRQSMENQQELTQL